MVAQNFQKIKKKSNLFAFVKEYLRKNNFDLNQNFDFILIYKMLQNGLLSRVRLDLNFGFESAQELLMNLISTFAKSLNLNVLIKDLMNWIFSNQNLHCESSDL